MTRDAIRAAENGGKMGWSCRADASVTADVLWEICYAKSKSTNVFAPYLFELPSIEHRDGKITGPLMKDSETPGFVRRAGSWRIDANGNPSRIPGIVKRQIIAAFQAAEHHHSRNASWPVPHETCQICHPDEYPKVPVPREAVQKAIERM